MPLTIAGLLISNTLISSKTMMCVFLLKNTTTKVHDEGRVSHSDIWGLKPI